ncbi:MAG: DUF5681 domain-containing protein [Pseudomonadota bacterium]
MTDPYDIEAAVARIRENQFKKGKSGNPAGRPKGSRNMKTIVQEIANELHEITENGVTTKRSICELVFMILRRKATMGDLKAAKKRDKLEEKYGTPTAPNTQCGFLVVPEAYTPENTPLPIEVVEEDEP